jgi:cobalt-precorrin-5B (C1)-methyltransferase
MAGKRLRQGFTTGSAAAAGAKAGVLCLGGHPPGTAVDIPLPVEGRLTIPVLETAMTGGGCSVTIIKDGGDDPDATHKARITVLTRLLAEGRPGDVIIEGGSGVGRVTRPGLPVPVGESAINPGPRKQIRDAVLEGLTVTGLQGAVSVIIEVADGERIAQKTLNPRLGIVGGISILGTRGTVKPFSNEAYRETIAMSLAVAQAAGASTIGLATGGRSERLLKEAVPGLADVACVQVADFFSFSMKEAGLKGFADIRYACFFGKLVKMAQGHPYTHAKECAIDFDALAKRCLSLGMDRGLAGRVAGANTAHEALGIILGDAHGEAIVRDTVDRALISARGFAGPLPDITYYLFDLEGRMLGSGSLAGSRHPDRPSGRQRERKCIRSMS